MDNNSAGEAEVCVHSSLEGLIVKRRLRWLGHVARMSQHRIPGWLPQTRPAHGPRLRWRDKIRQDLKGFKSIKELGIR